MFCPLIKDGCYEACAFSDGEDRLLVGAAYSISALSREGFPLDDMMTAMEDIAHEVDELKDGLSGIIQTLYDR